MQLSDNLVKGVFDNVRNFLIVSAVIGAGVLILRHAPESKTAAYEYVIGGLSVLLGCGLFALNAAHGWMKFTELKLTKVGLVGLQLLYVLVFLEIVQKLWLAKIGL
jgi:hypothetical protein